MYQTNPSLPPKELLPTMYDLPSEDPQEPGLPDEFHIFQPELLRLTFRPSNYPPEQIFTATDLYLYYDVEHPQWYKRLDWFPVLDVSRFDEQRDLRISYVTWQGGVSPFIVIELLSPGTEEEDLGRTRRVLNPKPTKWQVYEQILQITYYIVFTRYTDELQVFSLANDRYQKLETEQGRFWIEEIQLGLGLWKGTYERINRHWLRWFDITGNWVPTPAEQEHQKVLELEAMLTRYREQFGELLE